MVAVDGDAERKREDQFAVCVRLRFDRGGEVAKLGMVGVAVLVV